MRVLGGRTKVSGEAATRRHGEAHSAPVSIMEGSQKQTPEGLEKCEQRAKTSKEDCTWQRGIISSRREQLDGKAGSHSESGILKNTEAGTCQS